MKPENLKSPFSWENRRIMIKDRILYVVECPNQSFDFPGWDHPDIFGNNNPVKIEYCSGNGAWIAEKAIADPNTNWVAVEKRFVRVRKIWSKIQNLNLPNLFIVCGEAFDVTSRFFPANSVSEVFINFPDPWPKHRHAKNRLIQVRFVQEIWRTLKKDAKLIFVTDDPKHSEWTIRILDASPGFESCYPHPHYITDDISYGTSYFDQLWRDKGKVIRYHGFYKRDIHE